MRILTSKIAATLALTTVAAPFAAGQTWNPPTAYPAVFRYWVEWADNQYLQRGQPFMAMSFYNEAYRMADERRDAINIAVLSDRYLRAGSPVTALNVLRHARDVALRFAESRNPAERNYGLRALGDIGNLYNTTLRLLSSSAELRMVAQDAIDNRNRIANKPIPPQGPTRTNVVGGIRAVARKNGLEGNNPTRGFGDSDQTDRWIPFSFSFGVPGTIAYAKLKYNFKPIGQLVSTDSMLARGASGKVHVLYDQYHLLAGDRWYEHTILIKDPDLIAAIQRGALDCLLQDDTALWNPELEIYYR